MTWCDMKLCPGIISAFELKEALLIQKRRVLRFPVNALYNREAKLKVTLKDSIENEASTFAHCIG